MSTLENDPITLRRAHLLAASALVPADRRAEFFTLAFMGPDVIQRSASVQAAAMPNETPAQQEETGQVEGESTSFPINVEQARQIKERIDEATWTLLTTAAANVQDGVGIITWSEVKKITGVHYWSAFAQGRMGGLHRSLSKIVGQRSVLLWEGEGWVEDGKGDFSEGTVCIDGPAVRSIQVVG